MASLATTANYIKENYLPLIKGRQTGLLTLTGIAGYLSQAYTHRNWWVFIGLACSLLITISGCTVFNMLIDRDIDCRMERTRHRPLAEGSVNPSMAAYLGGALLVLGLSWAALLSLPYFAVILAGACLNVLVYTVWLKRRTAWSILWGGLAGGMPIMAGRVLAVGHVDLLGLMLGLIIVFWIPSHNLTLSMLYSQDYHQAGVPTVLNSYGDMVTRHVVTLSSLMLSIIIFFVFIQLDMPGFSLFILLLLGIGLVSLAVLSSIKRSRKLLEFLYRYSSVYLLVSTVFLVLNGLI